MSRSSPGHRAGPCAQRFLTACSLAVALSLPVGSTMAQGPGSPAQPSTTPLPSASRIDLPGLGDAGGMSLSEERRLGDRIARDIYRDPDYLDDPVLGDYLQSVWQPLLAAARARGDVPPELAEQLAWELMISRDRSVNAFALPGGYLGVHLGLLAMAERTDELASVLAHELSHVSQRHIARLVSNQDRVAPWMMGAMILGVLAARANADVASAAIASSQALAVQNQLNFSRDMEREADRVGFGVLTGAGFDGLGFVQMFDRLQQASRLNDDGSFPYLRSHPLTSERVADMRARLPLAGAPAARTPGVLHALMSARARVLAEPGTERLRAWLQTGQTAGATAGERYAAAFSALRLGQHAQALQLAERLRDGLSGRERAALDALLLETLLAAHGQGANRQPLQPALLAELRDQALGRESRADVLQGAQAAIATGQAQRAAERLQRWVLTHPRDAMAWQTLAQARQAQGQSLRALRAEAEARAAQMDYDGAIERFRAAQALPADQRRADPVELAIVDTRRRDMERLQRELAKDMKP